MSDAAGQDELWARLADDPAGLDQEALETALQGEPARWRQLRTDLIMADRLSRLLDPRRQDFTGRLAARLADGFPLRVLEAHRRRRRRRTLLLAAAALLMVVLGGAWWLTRPQPWAVEPQSGLVLRVGERQLTADPLQLRLAAGGTIAVEAGSEIEPADDGLTLLAGAVRVSLEPQPPGGDWLLRTPQAEVRVVGTRFTVAVAQGSTTVVVESGVVAVTAAGETLELRARDRSRIEAGAAPRLVQQALEQGLTQLVLRTRPPVPPLLVVQQKLRLVNLLPEIDGEEAVVDHAAASARLEHDGLLVEQRYHLDGDALELVLLLREQAGRARDGLAISLAELPVVEGSRPVHADTPAAERIALARDHSGPIAVAAAAADPLPLTVTWERDGERLAAMLRLPLPAEGTRRIRLRFATGATPEALRDALAGLPAP